MDDDATEGEARAARYHIEATLGQGGMAVVHAALDRTTGRRVALKRLRFPTGTEQTSRLVDLFEREYLTLAQLRHPSIVQVYDYGVDSDGPYYTMELLDGGDLQALSPVPWRRVCAIARDVCSVLALLHSRRMVYRDLSPRNVRITQDGAAKLIDFGAMSPMGPSREFVGTMPFVPPEALNQQLLDGRSDLYALGATLYFSLVQRHAYPARDIAQLRELWRARPRRPSEFVPDIPEALDHLVTDLMHPDPSVRPANAAEVIARLGAIAGLRASEHLLVPQAYLSTPVLVGRIELLGRARQLMVDAHQQHGSAVMLRGVPGAGRSRMLDAYVLEAKLAGLIVLRADSSDAQHGKYGAVRAILEQLMKTLGPSTLVAEVDRELLGHAFPDMFPRTSGTAKETEEDARPQHPRLQQALRHWLLSTAREHPLMIAIDDLTSVDEPSAAFLGLLAHEMRGYGLVIVTSVQEDDGLDGGLKGAIELLAAHSTIVSLAPLSPAQTEELLRSVFGDAPNLSVLARYVQGISNGIPRDIMQLAQHLVSEEVIQYRAGTWSLPLKLDDARLPVSMTDALRMRVVRLSPASRAMALGFALEPRLTFTLEDCVVLSGAPRESRPAHLLQTLDELVAAEILAYNGGRYGLRQATWISVLTSEAPTGAVTTAHLRLATILESRADGFRTAAHLLKGGQRERGLDVLVQDAIASELRTDADSTAFSELLSALPPDWLSTYEHGISLCRELHRPAMQRDALLSRLSALISFGPAERDGYVYIEERIARLRADCGLDDFEALPSTLDYQTRIKRALEAAATRYHATPPHDRLGDPGWAIKQIAKTTLMALGRLMFTLDYQACVRLPSLTPLVPLSPAIEVVHKIRQGLGARLVGRIEEAVATYEGLLARIALPDRGGLTEVHHMGTRIRILHGLGMLDAAMGRAAALERAGQVESEPIFAIQGMFVRHIHFVWQGKLEEADRYKQRIQIAQLESNVHSSSEGQHLLSELVAYALCEDMTRVKRATDAAESCARVHHAWLPVIAFGRGEYHRIRGDHEAALAAHEQALSGMAHGLHQIWVYAAGAHVRTLTALGRYAQACERGQAYLNTAAEVGLGYLRCFLRMPLSLALSKLGSHDVAIALAQSVIDELQALGTTGLLLASAYETRARADREAGNLDSFARYAARSAELWPSGTRRFKGAKDQSVRPTETADPALREELSLAARFSSMLRTCETADQRAAHGLAFLGSQSGAVGGILYTYSGSGLVRSATFGQVEADEDLDEWAAERFMREIHDVDETSACSNPPPALDGEPIAPGGNRLVSVLLNHPSQRGTATTGLAVLLLDEHDAFIYPTSLVAELSRALETIGKVDPIYS